jgi:2-methylcitrate dehydratase PrpD
MHSATLQLADFVCDFDPQSLPQEAIRTSKTAVLDCIGVALAAFREPVSGILRDYVQSTPSLAEATLWGTNCRVSSLDAALVNGSMAHALDYDDLNRFVQGHPSVVLVPAVFAVGEKLHSPGRRVLEAYIVGFEVMAKLGMVLNPGLYEKGWHPTSVIGIIGAAASAAYLLGLDEAKTVNALGIAASEASGIKKNFGSMTKPLHAGSASRKGVWAAFLAQRGLTADPHALDGTFGFLELFKGDLPFDTGPLEHLGNPLEIISSGIVVKQYPCCGSTHPVLDGAIEIADKIQTAPAQVQEIECKINPRRLGHINRPQVHSGLEAKFSLQFCTAAALIDRRITLTHFAGDAYKRPDILRLMDRVHVLTDESLGEFAAVVTVRTKDGKAFTTNISETRGSPAFPLSESQLMGKFVDCATTVVSQEQAERAGQAIMDMENESDVSRLMEMLNPDFE